MDEEEELLLLDFDLEEEPFLDFNFVEAGLLLLLFDAVVAGEVDKAEDDGFGIGIGTWDVLSNRCTASTN